MAGRNVVLAYIVCWLFKTSSDPFLSKIVFFTKNYGFKQIKNSKIIIEDSAKCFIVSKCWDI